MRILPALFVALALSGAALAFQQQEPAVKTAQVADPKADEAKVIAQQLPSYPLTECPISHEHLDAMGKPLDVVQDGRLVRLCCKGCLKKFKAEPATVFAAIDKGVIEAQKASYPMEKCPVSGEALGGMGEPKDMVYGTRLVRLCCPSCEKGFAKEPAKFMAQVDAALIAKQKPSYPLTTCMVSGETIGADGVDHLYGTRLTRFCCDKCVVAFDKEPAKYLAQLDKAAPQKN